MSKKVTLTHNEALQRAGLPSTEVLAKRLLRVFDAATPAQVAEGATWYSEGRELALMLAPHLTGPNATERAAEVVAATSARTIWSRNVAIATALILQGTVLPGALGRNVEMARAVIDGARLAEVTSGPKIQSFAANLSGDVDEVTVDIHAAWAAGVDPDLLGRVGVYPAVQKAYRLAAARRGVDPCVMQATVWVVQRKRHWTKIRSGR